MITGHRDRGEDAAALGRRRQFLGEFLDGALLIRFPATQRRRILAALRRQQHVDHGSDENESRSEHIDPDAGDMGGGVVAHQLDPEAANTVGGDVERKQPAVTEAVLAVDVEQEHEDQQVPQQFVEERRMHDGGHLAGRDAVERVHVDDAGRITAIEDLHAPGDGGLSAVEFLIEVVAQPADRLRQHDARSNRIPEGRQWNSPAATGNPRSDTTEGDGTPDA